MLSLWTTAPNALRLIADAMVLVVLAAGAIRTLVEALRAAIKLRNEWYARPGKSREPR